jgi:hypothetical protein
MLKEALQNKYISLIQFKDPPKAGEKESLINVCNQS